MKITESKLRKIIREVIREGFAGPLSKTKQKKFEADRRRNSEVLGFKRTGKSDVKTSIGLTEAARVQFIIPESDKRQVNNVLKKLKLKAGTDYDFGTASGANFTLDLNKNIQNKVLDMLIKNNVRVKG